MYTCNLYTIKYWDRENNWLSCPDKSTGSWWHVHSNPIVPHPPNSLYARKWPWDRNHTLRAKGLGPRLGFSHVCRLRYEMTTFPFNSLHKEKVLLKQPALTGFHCSYFGIKIFSLYACIHTRGNFYTVIISHTFYTSWRRPSRLSFRECKQHEHDGWV